MIQTSAPAEETPEQQPPVCVCHHQYALPNTYQQLPNGNLVDKGTVQFYRCQVTQEKTQVVLAPVEK